ncbi:hypothetical protein P4O66_003563 [Electrophorus voltai]|uniref:Uncharacterized protein n=1 Tax=Electrophorus voltai TaxID=2609070 RepID=A0AAD9E7A4_9TELE|nr:hypothetical protein P4O66_003563 [Electrophorus voltai]
MPGKGSKRRKGKKGGKCPSTIRTMKSSVILASLHTPTTGEEATGGFLGSPEYGPQLDYEDRHLEGDSTGSYDSNMDYYEGYADYGDNGECSNVSLWSDLGFNYGEDLSMEVEEVLYGDPPNISDVESADSKSDEPQALKILPKAPPRRCRLGASKPSRAAQREMTAFEEETSSTTAYSPGTCVSVPKPRRGKGEATPVPIPETGKATGGPPVTGARKQPPPKLAKGNPPQAGGTPAQPTTGGQFVPVPVTVSIPITLSVPVALSLFVSVPVPVSVSVIVLIPVLPPSVLLTLACSVPWPHHLALGVTLLGRGSVMVLLAWTSLAASMD